MDQCSKLYGENDIEKELDTVECSLLKALRYQNDGSRIAKLSVIRKSRLCATSVNSE